MKYVVKMYNHGEYKGIVGEFYNKAIAEDSARCSNLINPSCEFVVEETI